jgi:hypothetical protein
MFKPQVMQGRLLTQAHLEELRVLIAENPRVHRTQLSRMVAERWCWRSPGGQLKDMAARTLMLKLHERGLIGLPDRHRVRRKLQARPLELFVDPTPSDIEEPLGALLPVRLTVLRRGEAAYRKLSGYLEQHHYLGFKGPVGENLMYRVQDRTGRDVACVLFGAAAWKVAPRDTWIGWNRLARTSGIQRIANNSRFLIYPWVSVPHMASHILGRIARRIAVDWQAKYNHPIALLETFVEHDRFRGTCYKAANWICVGQTQGRSRQDRTRTLNRPVKDIYLYPLGADFRQALIAATPEAPGVHA